MSAVAASGAFSRKSRKVLRPSASWIVMKPPPPRLPAAGIDDRQRIADRDRGVDGVAAPLQDVDADLGRQVLGGDHHAVLGRDRRHRGGKGTGGGADRGDRGSQGGGERPKGSAEAGSRHRRSGGAGGGALASARLHCSAPPPSSPAPGAVRRRRSRSRSQCTRCYRDGCGKGVSSQTTAPSRRYHSSSVVGRAHLRGTHRDDGSSSPSMRRVSYLLRFSASPPSSARCWPRARRSAWHSGRPASPPTPA